MDELRRRLDWYERLGHHVDMELILENLRDELTGTRAWRGSHATRRADGGR
jgi:hypothetical protein